MNTLSVQPAVARRQESEQNQYAKNRPVTFQQVTDTKQALSSSLEEAVITAGLTPVSPEDMTMAEYKAYIYDKLSKIPIHPSRNNNNIFISITEEGFAAMKQDPAYEKWVLDYIKKDFAAADPFGRSSVAILRFGASKEEFKAESWSVPTRAEMERLRKEAWERKQALKKKRKKLLEKKWLEEKWKKEAYLKAYVQLKHLDHKQQLEEENKALALGKCFTQKDHDTSLRAAAKRKTIAYEATFLFSGIGMK